MEDKRGFTIRELIQELEKLPEQDKDKMIWQKLDFYMGGILSISKGENGDYILNESEGEKEDKLKYINEFLGKLKEKYPSVNLKYKYDDGEYIVTHDYDNEFDDEEWENIVGALISDVIFVNDIYNFSFYNDYGLENN